MNAASQEEEIGTGLPTLGSPLFSNQFYYVRQLVTQRILGDGTIWNYAVINNRTGYAEAYSSNLPSSIMAANALSKKLDELYHEDNPPAEPTKSLN